MPDPAPISISVREYSLAPIVASSYPEGDRACAVLPLTDLGNAERFRVRFGHIFRFRSDTGWMIRRGNDWAVLPSFGEKVPSEVAQAAILTVRAIANEAKLVLDSGRLDCDSPIAGAMNFAVKGSADRRGPTLFSDMLGEHAKASENRGRISAIPALVKRLEAIDQCAELNLDGDAERFA